MKKRISILWFALAVLGCKRPYIVDGPEIQQQVLAANDLSRDSGSDQMLHGILDQINCADSAVLKKRLVLAGQYSSGDTTQILIIPFSANGSHLKSDVFSNIAGRFILVNPGYIREFTAKNTLNDTLSYRPVIELMLLHEVGHFLLGKEGAFDQIVSNKSRLGQQVSNSQPEYMTSLKKIELGADSLAIDMVKRSLKPSNNKCLDIGFDVERVVPGMQFQLSGRRMIDNFGSKDIGFLHDPSTDHPNLELRVTFMNYFLYPSDSLKQIIDNYIYNRTVAPVHRQEFDPQIFQGQEKQLN